MRLEDDMSFGKRTEARMLAKFAVSDPLLEIVAVSIVRAHLSTVVVNRHLRSFRHNAGFIPGATLAERFRLRRVKRVNRAGRMGQFNETRCREPEPQQRNARLFRCLPMPEREFRCYLRRRFAIQPRVQSRGTLSS